MTVKSSTIKPPGFANLLRDPGDVMTVAADGTLEAVPAATLVDAASAWAAGTTYPAGAIVSGSDDNLYVSIAAGNIGHNPTTDAGVHWAPAGIAAAWSATTTYGAGAVVSGSDDNVYVSLAAANLNNNPTTDAGVHWAPAGIADVWSATTTYGAGTLVTGSDLNVYVSLAAGNLNHDPTTDQGANWQRTRNVFQNSIVAASAAISNAETLLVNLPVKPNNTLRAKVKVRMTIEGTCTSTHADVPTFNIRAGILGTVADALVAAIALPVSVIGGPTAFKVVIEFTVRVPGAGGTCAGSLAVFNGGATGLGLAPTQVIPFTSATLATTTATFLDLSFVAAAATTSITVQDASIETL